MNSEKNNLFNEKRRFMYLTSYFSYGVSIFIHIIFIIRAIDIKAGGDQRPEISLH